MLVAQRWVLARLRNQTCFTLGALNAAIRVLLDGLNDRPMKKLGVSRRALHEQLDRPALRPLPADRYVLARWKRCRVNLDYHVLVERHAYSVPFQNILAAGQDRLPLEPPAETTPTPTHTNIRGAAYYAATTREDPC